MSSILPGGTPTKWAIASAGTPALRIPPDATAHLERAIILDVSNEAAQPIPAGETVALHLAQVGTQAAYRFAQEMRELGLLPSHAGIIRALGSSPGVGQRALGRRLFSPELTPGLDAGYRRLGRHGKHANEAPRRRRVG